MGFFERLFCPPQRILLQPEKPVLSTALTQTAIEGILRGTFRAIPVKKIVLRKNEECLFCDHAVLVTEKLRVVGHKRVGHHYSLRIVKGFTYHTSDGGNVSIRDNIQEYTLGKLYITTKRIVFSAGKRAFQKPLSSLISYQVEEDELVLQFSSDSYVLTLPVPICAEKTLNHLI